MDSHTHDAQFGRPEVVETGRRRRWCGREAPDCYGELARAAARIGDGTPIRDHPIDAAHVATIVWSRAGRPRRGGAGVRAGGDRPRGWAESRDGRFGSAANVTIA